MRDNIFFKSVDDSMILTMHREFLDNYRLKKDKNFFVEFVYTLLDYGPWGDHFQSPLDIFQFLSKKTIKRLKHRPELYFIFDASLEGFSQHNVPVIDVLYYNCKKYNISYNKIIFITSNLKDKNFLIEYNKENNIVEGIKLISFPFFKNTIESNFLNDQNIKEIIKDNKLLSKKIYNNKIFLSMSRIKRDHRILATYLLYTNNLTKYSLCSHDTLSIHETIDHAYPIDKEKYYNFLKTLPYTIDTSDFKTNYALYQNENIYKQVLFEVVNETFADNFNNTSLFYSEKTFKPIINTTPFFIFGQQYCNQRLEDYGFKLYRDYFNYDFDDEPNTFKRYIKIISMLKDLTVRLDILTPSQKLDWKYKNEEILEHNFETLRNTTIEKRIFFKLYKKIKNEIISSQL